MHFSKTYAQLLSTLPPELRNNAFEYRKLKKLIKQTVSELDSLGLGPSVLQSLRRLTDEGDGLEAPEAPALITSTENELDASCKLATLDYGIVLNSTPPELRLRLSRNPSEVNSSVLATQSLSRLDLLIPEQLINSIARALLHSPITFKDGIHSQDAWTDFNHFTDLTIPLPSDTAFFQLLTSTLSSQSSYFDALLDNFNATLTALAASISLTALPSSSDSHSFSAYSVIANNATTLRPRPVGKSDLYIWREIFRLYAEAQVFESIKESSHGERDIEDAKAQLRLFEKHIQERKVSLVLPASKGALDIFLSLNVFILDVKKFQLANAEAIRKILKKHAKRTTFTIPSYLFGRDTSISAPVSCQLTPVKHPSNLLPRLLVQAIGEVLLPVIPHIDDYVCLICTYVAFRPVRLCCGHFFCVRCLAKLQRRGVSSCPLCRAPTVLKAAPANLDYGLLNFIADWFPLESLEKLRVDELEINREQLEALGVADHNCQIM